MSVRHTVLPSSPEALGEKQALTIAEFCHCYRVGRTFVWGQIKAGLLQAKHAGRRCLISRADAETWFANLPTKRSEEKSYGELASHCAKAKSSTLSTAVSKKSSMSRSSGKGGSAPNGAVASSVQQTEA